MQKIKLYEYQQNGIGALRQSMLEGKKRIVLCAPT